MRQSGKTQVVHKASLHPDDAVFYSGKLSDHQQ